MPYLKRSIGFLARTVNLGKSPRDPYRRRINDANLARPPPEPIAEASHLSTRDLLFDREGLVYMVVRREMVSMRASDFHLNASQILNVAGLHGDKRKPWLEIFRERGVGGTGDRGGRPNYWVPFHDGVFLCRAVGLEYDLQPLLSWAPLPLPDPNQNYFMVAFAPATTQELPRGFASLSCGDVTVAYQPPNRTINATHLLKAGKIHRSKLADFFAEHPEVQKTKMSGNSKLQGTYITLEGARTLCSYFDLRFLPVLQLLNAASPSVDPGHFPTGNIVENTSNAGNGKRGFSKGPQRHSSDHPDARSASQALDRDQTAAVAAAGVSVVTEASYRNGSYLAPSNRSYLQLLD